MILSDETIERFFSERHPDWEIATEYGEPGYWNTRTTHIVLGSYWCRCGNNPHAGQTQYHGKVVAVVDMHTHEDHHPLFWHQLESQGVEFEWHDEWAIVDGKAYRLHADSYQWQPSIIMSDYDEWLTPDTPIEVWIDTYCGNNPKRCLPSNIYTGDDLEAIGFVRHNGQFEAGWHPGQTDNPVEIHAAIRAAHPDDTIVFVLDETSQFYSKFSAYHRSPDWEADTYPATENVSSTTGGD